MKTCRSLILMASLSLAVASLFWGGCTPPPPLRPAMSQTVVTVQRYQSKDLANQAVEIYIDDKKVPYFVQNGGAVSFPVNDGVHLIYTTVGNIQSDILNFTAAQKTVSFVVSVEKKLFSKPKIILSRSKVIDDTGTMTEKTVQEKFVPEEE